MTHQYINHSQSIRQYKIGVLIIVIATYGIDYYWRDKAGYMFTSAPFYICADKWIADVRFGVIAYPKGNRIVKLPKWWTSLWVGKA